MQLIAVVGSLTAGEIARRAMSTIWIIPNSTSCCIVRVGPMSIAFSNRGFAFGGHSARIDDPNYRSAGGNEMADLPIQSDLIPKDLAQSTRNATSTKRTYPDFRPHDNALRFPHQKGGSCSDRS